MTSETLASKSFHSFLSRSTLALSIKIAAIFFAVWATYSKDLTIITNEAIQSESTTYLLAMPFLFAYLIFRERKMLRAVIPFKSRTLIKKIFRMDEIFGIMLGLLAFLLYWQGSYSPYPLELHVISLLLFVAGLILIIFNTQTLRVLALPIIFLLFLIPAPLEIIYAVNAILATYTSSAVSIILRTLSLPVVLTNQYGLPVLMLEKPAALPLTVVLDAAFVGTYFLTVATVFWVFVVISVRGAAWKRAMFLLAWGPSVFVFNTIRITFMILATYRLGIDATNEGLYTTAGWFLTLTGTFLFLFFVSRKILKIQVLTTTKPRLPHCPSCNDSQVKKQSFCLSCGKLLKYVDIKISKQDILKIATLLIIINLSAFLKVPAFVLRDDNIQAIIYLPTEGKIVAPVLPEIDGYTLRLGYSDEKIETMVGPNALLTYVYTPRDESKPTIYGTIEFAHPKNLPVFRGEVLDSRDVQVFQNPPIMGRVVSLHKPNSNLTLEILYWHERALFDAEPTIVRKYERISVFAFSSGSADSLSVVENLLFVGQTIAGYLEPARVWSNISSLFPLYLYALSVMIIGLLAVISTVQILNSKKERRFNLKVFNKLDLDEEKNVLLAIHQAEKTGKSSQSAIAVSFQNLAGKPVDEDMLSDTLRYAGELGLVKSRIVSENGKPVLVWKTQIAFPSSKQRLQRIRNLSRTNVLKTLRH